MPAVCQVNNIDIDLIYSDTIEENIISINTKKELFFDVYECTINDEKLVLEKVGDSELGPKVLLEINIEGKKYSAEAILVDNGKTYIELNKENIYFIRTIPEETVTEEKNEIEEVDIEEVDIEEEETSDNLEVNYENIIEHHVNNKLVFLHELEEQFEEKIVSLKDDISNKLDLFFEKLEDKKKVIVEEKLEKITDDLNEKFIVLQSELQGVEDFSKKNIDNILETKINEIDSSVSSFLDGITKEYTNKIISSDKKITHNFLELNSIKEKLKENNSATNKKFEDLNFLKEKLLEQDELVLKNEELKKFINEEFKGIDSKFKNLSEGESKKYDELLAAVNNKDVVEYKTILKEKIQDVELTQIKESLQEEISSALKGDIVSLKRYVEMSSGGGSTAKQFAAGGTMDGNLTVVGDLSARTYLGIDIPPVNGLYLPLSGGNLTGTLSSNNTIVADTILATNLLSATNLDIGFELSGFNVTGNISASGGLSANNINVTGDILPSQTTTFNLGSSALRFKDIFLDGSTIDLSGTKISTDSEGDIEFRDAANLPKRLKASEIILESSNDPDNDIVFKVNSGGNPEFQKRRRSNPNIIEPSITTTDVLSATQVRVDGDVGIGTSSPSKKLDVVGDIEASGDIQAQTMTVGGAINANTIGGTISTPAQPNITSVGTLTTLTVSNDADFNGNLDVDQTINTTQITAIEGTIGGATFGSSDTSHSYDFVVDTDTFVVDTSENKVGIGTTSPTEKLEVSGDLMLQENGVIKNKNNNTQFRFGVNDLYLDAGHLRAGYSVGIRGNRGSTKGMEQGSTLNSDLGIYCGGNEAISIHSDGDTLVNNDLEVEGTTTVGKITLSDNSFVVESSSFTLGSTHRGATVLLQNTGAITITVPQLTAGHTTTFIAETSNSVVFASGAGLSAFNSFNSANQIAGIFGQAQIIFKSSTEAFLGGNVV